MKFLERDLEDIIFNSDPEKLNEKGLYVPVRKVRQLRIGNYGIADIVGLYTEYWDERASNIPHHTTTITIYELKQEKISVSAFLQAMGYLKGIKHYIDSRKIKLGSITYKIVLVGKIIDKESQFIYLTDLLESYNFELDFYTYDYDIDGIKFTRQSGYQLSNPNFHPFRHEYGERSGVPFL